ncbi:glycosyltransferase involved in cell wall biosynthesis [Pedobacter sp. W3I1]|uniref:glycosyltransferase family 2 protein n=1 Tax=Pedobacter sp. W3I1 TaxID=3042291 RepID=UPI002782FBDA|nr:glycosyltransferase family A protein [Pedobacter sp. W3I1]MDQ0640911.1 glycosyltransferase involved in cell wall biosynthesis [Pedobacter sp. W3I1]
MSLTPLVSICIPAYNTEKHISTALDSLFAQSYKNIEVIVVNDGSKDKTLDILNEYKWEKLHIIDQDNKGQCAAANEAFKYAKGEYIKFFDADDILSPDFIKNQVNALSNTENTIASSAWGRFYNDDLNTFQLNNESVWRDMLPIDWLVESLGNGPNMMQCALWLIPRKILLTSGLWDERLSLINDFDFFIRVLLASKKIMFTKNATLYYRSGLTNSLSNQKTRQALESAFLSTKLGVENILKFENSERTKPICADALKHWCYIFYPQHMDLYKETNNLVNELGGSNYAFPAGGKTKFLVNLFGWKITKRIKSYLHIQ